MDLPRIETLDLRRWYIVLNDGSRQERGPGRYVLLPGRGWQPKAAKSDDAYPQQDAKLGYIRR